MNVPLIRLFSHRQVREAIQYASESGGVALHIWNPPLDKSNKVYWPGAPAVFLRHKLWAHLLDQNKDRLMSLAKFLGIRKIYVDKPDQEGQHVDLCGKPLANAVLEAEKVCSYCGEPKVPGERCHGNDECIYGPEGGKALCCQGWGRYCCKCGASFARGQV